ncbi:MAG: penicillin-binding transpeptidase domain-containing protein [Lachnospiraceae bacterium]|nr:penicillin-binding transpeptidase domain-containing protein [Lachnospiraceae bacterium]
MFKTVHRTKIVVLVCSCIGILLLLMVRLCYLMAFQSSYYEQKAEELHERERTIKAARGRILDVNGKVLADNKTVCTVSVIHNQITQKEKVISILSEELKLPPEKVRERVEKYSSIERIRSNVDKKTGDRIRAYHLDGVKVDEDYKRYYPYESLAFKVLGFTGGDNQGIVGLEVKYEEALKGAEGQILTMTDARGVEIEEAGKRRLEPVPGKDLVTSLDLNIQSYATQLAEQVMESKQADSVSILVINPQNGEIYACVNVPEFDLNDPFSLPEGVQALNEAEEQDLLNKMWRNACLNDTYEPGSTFKIITAAAGLEADVVSLEDHFSCPGYIVVEDRRIRCSRTTGHGNQTFEQATMNSCNSAFITIGLRLGTEQYYSYFKKFGLLKKTGIDLPGEASTIMHKPENIGMVELATIAFGQSFQITPIQLAVTASSIINGGRRVTPHVGVKIVDPSGGEEILKFPEKKHIVSEQTSETMRSILEQVVANGTGKKGAVEGYRIGGKTATSQTLPRGSGRYIASFLGFAPAEKPTVLALCIINNPKGIYYGGQIAVPVVRKLFENILPYLMAKAYN